MTESFLAGVGFISILLAVFIIMQKVNSNLYRKRISGWRLHRYDQRVSEAAREFSLGRPAEEIRAMLSHCACFDEEDMDEILLAAEAHRLEGDRGYRAFLDGVNRTLGGPVY